MSNLSRILILAGLMLCAVSSRAQQQQVHTSYFIENDPLRHHLNAAFQPLSNVYVSFPVIGHVQIGAGLPFSLSDIIYKRNGQEYWFLDKSIPGGRDQFLNALGNHPMLGVNTEFNLLGFGFRAGRSYWTFALTEKVVFDSDISKGFFSIIKGLGPDGPEGSTFDLNPGLDFSAYTEAALGYSLAINDRLTVGGKLKYLIGNANVSMKNDNLKLITGMDKYILEGSDVWNIALPVSQFLDEHDKINPKLLTNPGDYLKTGTGGAIDLGAGYKFEAFPLSLSLAVNDLGLISWNGNNNLNYDICYEYEGIAMKNLDFENFADELDSIISGIKDNIHYQIGENRRYRRFLMPKVNVGAEYAFLANTISVGALYHHRGRYDELTASLNLRPSNWINLSGSYSVLDGKGAAIGAGLGLRIGFINLQLATDYVSLNNSRISKVIDYSVIPYKAKGLNMKIGLNFVFGNSPDKDRDGVKNKYDLCPDTPRKVAVDKSGCPLDTDGDGVPDYLDQCPGTPAAANGTTDEYGCPVDSDSDGIPDYLDKCPNTPEEFRHQVDKQGCLPDADGDGVPDYLDECPNTPVEFGHQVNKQGCLPDADGDGVPDVLDKCPNTPVEAYSMIDEKGCPKDSDGDGVPDYLDQCPNTPAEAYKTIDKNGCPKDSDGDGIPDYLDQCPGTQALAIGFVDSVGCPLDTDNDGIFDYEDNCPKTPGVKNNHGCPELKKEIRSLFQKAMQGIQFETGKSTIKPVSYAILDEIAKVFIDNPNYQIEIQGHTDNTGNPGANLRLSEDRANSVRDYLIKKGVSSDRMKAVGYGDTQPVASNKDSAGRAKNRRVEFVISFEEVTYE